MNYKTEFEQERSGLTVKVTVADKCILYTTCKNRAEGEQFAREVIRLDKQAKTPYCVQCAKRGVYTVASEARPPLPALTPRTYRVNSMKWQDATRSINGVLKLQDVTLTEQIGKYPPGTHFDWVFIEPLTNGPGGFMRFMNVFTTKKWVDGKLELIKEKKQMGLYEMAFTVKEIVNEA